MYNILTYYLIFKNMKLWIKFSLEKAIVFVIWYDIDENMLAIWFLCFFIFIQKVYKWDKRIEFINNL